VVSAAPPSPTVPPSTLAGELLDEQAATAAIAATAAAEAKGKMFLARENRGIAGDSL
jgi:hypothetical protein